MNTRITNKLVAKALRRFSLTKGLRSNQIKTKRWRPDITISRDPGSGGRLVAKKIAKHLDWQLLDKELMIKLADKLGLPAKEFANVDEHTRNWFSDSFNAIFNPNYVSDMLYLKHLKRLLMQEAREGDAVIVGRGANHIIPADKCLRVRVTASFSDRVKNTMKHEGKTRDDAEFWVKYVEDKRTNFIKQYFGVNPYNPWHYDLVINTDHLTLIQARNLIIQAYIAKFPSERRRLKDKI